MRLADAEPGAREGRGRARPSPQTLVVLAAAVAGARLGLRPVSDNSTLVHLRTGLELVRTGHVPRHDPYSFTAPGHPWVVQSWFASLLYGAAYRVGSHVFIALQGAVMGATAAVVALTARASTAWRSGLAATIAIAASAPGWSPRPLMFELLCLALVVFVTERDADPRWLVPIVWLWVNSHGSYPLGLAWLCARGVGEAVDRRGVPAAALRRVGWFGAGLVVAMVNPLTWRLLTFPFVALDKRAVFQGIVEWRSPNFQNGNSFVALVFIAAALLILLRARLPWSDTLPVIGFLALALVAERNLAPFAVVLAAPLAHALSAAPSSVWPDARRWAERVGRSARFCGVGAAVCAATALGLLVRSFGQPVLDLSSYPVAAVNRLAATGRLGPGHRIAEIDVVGCYLVWRAGPSTKVFLDDRYDMYPAAVTRAASVLSAGQGGEQQVLDDYHVDTVVWSRASALPGRLEAGGWSQTYADAHWVVLERAGS